MNSWANYSCSFTGPPRRATLFRPRWRARRAERSTWTASLARKRKLPRLLPRTAPLSRLPRPRLTEYYLMKLESAYLQDFARRYAAAWCSQNAASVAAFFSPEGSLTINDGTPSVGRSAITQAAQEFMTAFPDMRVLLDNLVIQSDGAVFHWTLLGTNTGPGGTGHRVRISGFERWQFAPDGRIGRSLGNFDAADYQHQIQHGSHLASFS